MRDTRKNQSYYIAYLEYQHSRIEKKKAKLRDCNEADKKQRILLSLTGYEVDLLKAEFSIGASVDDLRGSTIRAIGTVKENKAPAKEDLLVILTLSILLDIGSIAKELIPDKGDIIENDRVLSLFAGYIQTGEIFWNAQIPLGEEYERLNDVFSADDKEQALNIYLAEWYDRHNTYAWYESHRRDTDTYCGYWSFESAALVKMLSLDENKVAGNEYYPRV